MTQQNLLHDLRRFYRFVRPYRYRAVMAVLLTTIVGTMGGGIAFFLKPYIDDVNRPGDSEAHSFFYPVFGEFADNILFYPVLIVVYSVAESLFSFGATYLTTWVGKRLGNDVKLELFGKLMRSDSAMFDSSTSGTVLVRYCSDADVATEGLLNNVKNMISRTVTSLVLIGTMLYCSVILTVVAMGCLSITVVPLTRVRRKLKEYIKESVQIGAMSVTHYTEAFSGNRIIASYNLYEYIEERLRQTLKDLFRLSIKTVQRTNSLSLVMHFATGLGIALTLVLKEYLIQTDRLSFGGFVAFVVALIALYTPMKKMGSMVASIQSSIMAIQRIQEILDKEPAIRSRPNAKTVNGLRESIKYEAVTFAYEPGKPVLKAVTLEIKAKQSVAFVGNSGGGKTTLVNLLPRFYDVDFGTISLDGVDIRDIELTSLRDLIAIVFQDNFLFGGTIRDNILLGDRNADDERIAAAVKAACLDEFIDSLENGLDTQIGERGVMLSGGQKQRVAIARAFLKDAPIVILDEATSALDNQSEMVVQQAIENLMLNKTVLIIAHRLSTVINADRIVVIKDGEMVESGTHAELMALSGGVYASLYKTQLA